MSVGLVDDLGRRVSVRDVAKSGGGHVRWWSEVVVARFKHASDAGIEGFVAGLVKEVAGRVDGWDGQQDLTVVFDVGGFRVVPELGSAFRVQFAGSEIIRRALRQTAAAASGGVNAIYSPAYHEVFGFLYCWISEGRSYKCVLFPNSDQQLVQDPGFSGGGLWERDAFWLRDLFGQQLDYGVVLIFSAGGQG